MTIVDAIKTVLSESSEGLTSKEIYNLIVEKKLYSFGAQNPAGVVNAQIRRRCEGLDFPSAFPTKIFCIVGYKGKKPLFHIAGTISPAQYKPSTASDNTETLPEEKMMLAYSEHAASIKDQVLENILNNKPSFFEHLVVDLLLKMGYGYDKNSGIVTGRSHDGGIDGVINEDKLGLDLIYIQAKRYSPSTIVGRKELQAFVGAMENIRKGVFITSSRFTKEAESFIERQQQKNIKLIDGALLADLIVKYELGISVVKNLSIYKVDADYFEE